MNWMRIYAPRFAVGAVGYGALEIVWCGRTHWTMLLLGGVCFLYLCFLDTRPFSLFTKCLLGALGITFAELCTGLLCNRLLHMNVWDYSAQWGNFYGQICPLYSTLWFLLCVLIFKGLHLVRTVRANAAQWQRAQP